ncbi:MAG TPA: hypothetical protein VNQ74_06140, partial [Burkholderiaceae bacterium]|nr:hypothetical protein [Burkholderiaceae bacterium]
YQVHNLAGDSAHAEKLADMRARLDRWMEESRDLGRQPEPEAMYDSDMAVYLGGRNMRPAKRSELEENIALMKRWASEGK